MALKCLARANVCQYSSDIVMTVYAELDSYSLMELFLLGALSRGGVHSSYDLQRVLGLEPGGIRPALLRLERDGLVVRSNEARRRRRLIKVTEQGQQVLQQCWGNIFRSYPDPESVLRAAGLAVLMAVPQVASDYLSSLADQYDQKSAPEQMRSAVSRSEIPAQCYGRMRALWQSRKNQAAAGIFREIAQDLAGLQQT